MRGELLFWKGRGQTCGCSVTLLAALPPHCGRSPPLRAPRSHSLRSSTPWDASEGASLLPSDALSLSPSSSNRGCRPKSNFKSALLETFPVHSGSDSQFCSHKIPQMASFGCSGHSKTAACARLCYRPANPETWLRGSSPVRLSCSPQDGRKGIKSCLWLLRARDSICTVITREMTPRSRGRGRRPERGAL